MKYFTIGPIQMHPDVCAAGGEQAAYFRDDAFAQKTIWMQDELLRVLKASADSKVAMLSGCGTTAMEASVFNFTKAGDHVVVLNGGSFGQRFVDMCGALNRQVHEIKADAGQAFDLDALADVLGTHPITAVFTTAHETSTGQKCDLEAIGKLARDAGALLICDAVSAIAADPFEMDAWGLNVVIFSSNKGLGLAPGIGFVVADQTAQERMACTESFVLKLEKYFAGAARGQPPYTPPISVLMQLAVQLNRIAAAGGVDQVVATTAQHARDFRENLKTLGLESFPSAPSNAITAFALQTGTSSDLYRYLKDDHDMLINMTAYGLGIDLPRVSHLGDLSGDDHAALIAAIKTYLEA